MSEKSKKAWEHLKNHSNIYTILCFVSALSGIYADYQQKVADLKDGQSHIEVKAKKIDSQAAHANQATQQNMNVVYERSLKLEGRLVAIETKLARVEKDNSSFWDYIIRSKPTSSQPEAYHHWDTGPDYAKEEGAGEPFPEELLGKPPLPSDPPELQKILYDPAF